MWIAGTFVEKIHQFDKRVTVKICSRQIKDGLPKNRRFLDDLPIKMVIDRRFTYENGDL
jgi:hypothetical protein